MTNNIIKKITFKRKLLAAAVALATASTANAYSDGTLETITVTARKVQENLQEVPVAVSTMSEGFIKDLNIVSVGDTLSFVPGATIISSSPGEQTFSIRGVASGGEGASSDSGVLVMVDNEVISRDFMRSAAMFDVQRVEILRGPQGTTYGRNATAGVLHVISNTPQGDDTASVTVDIGNYNRLNMDGYVDVDLSDTINGRLSFHTLQRDGYTEDAISGDDLDDWQENALRAQLLFEPSEKFSVLLRGNLSVEDGGNPGPRKAYDSNLTDGFRFDPGAAPYADVSNDPWKVQNSDGLFYEREIKGLSAEVHWDFDNINFTSITTYRDAEDKVRVDIFGTPRDMVVQNSANDASTWSQEIRFDNAGTDSNLHWLAGFFYLNEQHERVERKNILTDVLTVTPGGPLAGAPVGLDLTTTQDFSQNNETNSFGVFGELSVNLSEKTDISIGGRYSTDEKSFKVFHTADGVVAGLLIDENQVEAMVSDDWSSVTGKVSLSHQLSDATMLYASYSTGYKSGGFNPEPATLEAALVPFDEESVASFEIGIKTDLFEDTLRLNATVFDSTYDDIQIENHLPSGATFIENVASASIKGFELEYTWLATENFTIMGSFANYDHEYVDYQEIEFENGVPVVVDDFSGNPISNVPDWTLHASAIYFIELEESSVSLRLDYTDRSDIFDDEDPNSFQGIRYAEEMIHARATWTNAEEDWKVSLWAKNLGNNAEIVNIGPRSIMDQRHVVYGTPRTFGVTVTYNWM